MSGFGHTVRILKLNKTNKKRNITFIGFWHGRRSRGIRGDKSSPKFGAGEANTNCPPPDFVI